MESSNPYLPKVGKVRKALGSAVQSFAILKMGKNNYGERFMNAFLYPRDGFETAIKSQLVALATMADAHAERYERDGIGTDRVLGEVWISVMESAFFPGFLDGEIGRFDAGCIQKCCRVMALEAGFPDDRVPA